MKGVLAVGLLLVLSVPALAEGTKVLYDRNIDTALGRPYRQIDRVQVTETSLIFVDVFCFDTEVASVTVVTMSGAEAYASCAFEASQPGITVALPGTLAILTIGAGSGSFRLIVTSQAL